MNLKDLIARMDEIELKSNVTEAVTLNDILSAVGQEKDEQKRAAKLNDIAWKENLPGLYDPVSGYFIRKQSMPARSGARYNIAATAGRSDDLELSSKGLIPDNAKTTSPLGRLANRVTGADGDAYDRDIRARSTAAQKPPVQQAAQPVSAPSQADIAQGMSQQGDLVANRNSAPSQADIAQGMSQQSDLVAQRQSSEDLSAKRKRYAELLAKAKDSTVPSGSRM